MEWRSIHGFNGWIEINRRGEVRISPGAPDDYYKRKGPGDRLLSHDLDGYRRVNLKNVDRSGYSSVGIHRLLMMAFRPVLGMESLEVNHKNGNGLDNTFLNLEWVTKRENLDHAWRTGLRRTPDGKNKQLTPRQVREIRERWKGRSGREMSLRSLGAEYGVSLHAVWRIVHRKNWKYL